MDAAQLLDVVIAKAQKLRDAGVLRVRLEGLAFDLAPPEPTVDADDDGEQLDEIGDADPFKDPATYGGRVPGFRRREQQERR